MTRHRDTIDVDEYVDALRTWGRVNDRCGPRERAVIDAACAHLAARVDGVVAIEALCSELRRWSDERADPLVGFVRAQVEKSCLLSRLVYAGEPLRAVRCPIHDGHWSGAFDHCEAGCNFGAQVTGWLPSVPLPSTLDVRERILRAADAVDTARSDRRVRHGLFAATAAVRDEPLHADPRVWLWRVLASLALVRARHLDPGDEDGWALGGVATVRNLVEDARRSLR